ncbi:MAG: NUDIX domain-containing protein [Pseudomonadales bacterium]
MSASEQSASKEIFDIFNEDGLLLGQAARGRVHVEGLWHKSAQVFLFDQAGWLYLQQRVAGKDVCGGLWDMSVAEHLKPGESYLEGAVRGLSEELGVGGIALSPMGEPQQTRLDQPEIGIRDYELQQVFRGSYQGAMVPDPVEVDEVRAIALDDLATWVRDKPEDFTPWLLRDLSRYRILPAAQVP